MGFSTYFYKNAGLPTEQAFNLTLAQYSLGFFGTVGSWILMSYFGRRSLYLGGILAQCVVMAIIGGLGSIVGSFLGAGFILIIPIMLNLIPSELGVPLSTETIGHLEFIIFGSLICLLLIKEPHGFARLFSIMKEKLRLWPFPY